MGLSRGGFSACAGTCTMTPRQASTRMQPIQLNLSRKLCPTDSGALSPIAHQRCRFRYPQYVRVSINICIAFTELCSGLSLLTTTGVLRQLAVMTLISMHSLIVIAIVVVPVSIKTEGAYLLHRCIHLHRPLEGLRRHLRLEHTLHCAIAFAIRD